MCHTSESRALFGTGRGRGRALIVSSVSFPFHSIAFMQSFFENYGKVDLELTVD